jgi:hypothetical protein
MNERPKTLSEILRDEFDKANIEKPVSEWMKKEKALSLDSQIKTADVTRRGPAMETQP